ncbi:MAG TPA: tRNA lysidine(34) synthetase TilS [Prolixibacteraceae bacterium]|nr:tRNA lysidine(34) synthetase TilS [Prolixibacteraceae bacterium]
MYHQFRKYIDDNQLFTQSDNLLLGISGGVDSTVLLHLIDNAGYKFSIAHCNFNLRGSEADADQQFVEKLALEYGVKCHVVSFDTITVAAEQGISIEMAARQLRYNWFDQLCVQHGYNAVVVGHHLDDVLETFMLNLSRGTGIRGLSGIKPKTGRIVRPLLYATRNEIIEYAQSNNIEYRHDSSNDDVTIKRNKVRHQIIPLFEELNPSFKRRLTETIGYLNDTETIFIDQVEKAKKELIISDGHLLKISLSAVTDLHPRKIWLYELLRDYGFNSFIIDDLIPAIEQPEGQIFYSSSHRMVVDRYNIIINKIIDQSVNGLFYIEKGQDRTDDPVEMTLSLIDFSSDFKIPKSPNFAVLDFEKLSFPLMIRRWRTGEYFKPLGMSGFKKLSDFFIDQKMSIPEKENAWVLISDNKVVWIIGKRIDDRFKLTPNTKKVLQIELVRND